MKRITDDFGDCWYKCHYTTVMTHVDGVLVHGGFIPGVKTQIFYAANDKAKMLMKQSRYYFDEAESNCNTCAFMERLKHKKDKFGFVKIECTNPFMQHSPLQYLKSAPDDVVFWVHPDDPMGMKCYSPRQKTF